LESGYLSLIVGEQVSEDRDDFVNLGLFEYLVGNSQKLSHGNNTVLRYFQINVLLFEYFFNAPVKIIH